MRRLAPLLAVPLLAIAACDSSRKAPPPDAAATAAGSAAGQMPPGHPPLGGMPEGHPPMGAGSGMGGTGPAASGAAPVDWKVPEGWVATRPTNQMRLANFRVGEGDRALEVVVFGGIGGTAEQNVQRWIGQFRFADEASAKQAATVTETKVNGLELTRLDVTGEFSGGMSVDGGGPNERMLAVVVDGAAGPVQIKLVGPADVVAEHVAEFDAFVTSLRSTN